MVVGYFEYYLAPSVAKYVLLTNFGFGSILVISDHFDFIENFLNFIKTIHFSKNDFAQNLQQ